jgi:hypothetical protein
MVLTLLSLVIGYLTAQFSTALFLGFLLSRPITVTDAQFIAIASVCGLGFATLSGYLTALVARRSPIAHAGALSLVIGVIWVARRMVMPGVAPTMILSLAITVVGIMTGGWLRWRQSNT